jgi:hypothetical protein
MSRITFLSSALVLALAGCTGGPAADLTIVPLEQVSPDLPAVPTIPPPRFEVQYSDGSYSVFGIRRRAEETMNQDVTITGWVVDVFEPEPCEEGRTCPPAAAPHVWLYDENEVPEDRREMLLLTAYASNHELVQEAIENAQRPRPRELDADPLLGVTIPHDLLRGARIKVTAQFTRVGNGFSNSTGLLVYRSHETLQPPPDPEES